MITLTKGCGHEKENDFKKRGWGLFFEISAYEPIVYVCDLSGRIQSKSRLVAAQVVCNCGIVC